MLKETVFLICLGSFTLTTSVFSQQAQVDESCQHLKIEVGESERVVLQQDGAEVKLGGPFVEVQLQPETSLRLANLKTGLPSGHIDWDAQTTTFEGDYRVEILQGEIVDATLTAREAVITWFMADNTACDQHVELGE